MLVKFAPTLVERFSFPRPRQMAHVRLASFAGLAVLPWSIFISNQRAEGHPETLNGAWPGPARGSITEITSPSATSRSRAPPFRPSPRPCRPVRAPTSRRPRLSTSVHDPAARGPGSKLVPYGNSRPRPFAQRAHAGRLPFFRARAAAAPGVPAPRDALPFSRPLSHRPRHASPRAP